MAQEIGSAKAIQGHVTATGPEGSRELSSGSPVFKGDVLATAKASAGSIQFLDRTVLNIGEGSKVSLDQYVYDAAKGSGQVLFKLAQGTFRTVTGEIVKHNPESFKMQSPLATIGIRGTETAHTIPESGQGNENHLVMVFDGKPVIVQPLGGGAFQVLSQSGVKVEVGKFGAGPVLVMTPQEYKYYQSLTATGIQQGAPTDNLTSQPGTQGQSKDPKVQAAQLAANKAAAEAAAKAQAQAEAKTAADAANKAAAEAAAKGDPAAKAAADAAAKAAAEALASATLAAKAAAELAAKAQAEAFAAQQALALAEAAKAALAESQLKTTMGDTTLDLSQGSILTITHTTDASGRDHYTITDNSGHSTSSEEVITSEGGDEIIKDYVPPVIIPKDSDTPPAGSQTKYLDYSSSSQTSFSIDANTAANTMVLLNNLGNMVTNSSPSASITGGTGADTVVYTPASSSLMTVTGSYDGGTGGGNALAIGSVAGGAHIDFSGATLTHIQSVDLSSEAEVTFTAPQIDGDPLVHYSEVASISGASGTHEHIIAKAASGDWDYDFSNIAFTNWGQEDQIDITGSSNFTNVFHMGVNMNSTVHLDAKGATLYFTPDDTINGGGTPASNVPNTLANITDVGAITLQLQDNHTGRYAAANINLVLPGTTNEEGQTLTFSAGQLTAGHNLTLDASALEGSINFYAGAGIDSILGSGQDDEFHFGSNLRGDDTLFTVDTIDGGAGHDTLYFTENNSNGNELLGVTGIEKIVLGDATTALIGPPLNESDWMDVQGRVIEIDGSALTAVSGSEHTLYFNGSATTKGSFDIDGGAGNDTLKGANAFELADNTLDSGDTIHGNGGDDLIYGYAGYNALYGDAGNDTINGGDSSSTLPGSIETIDGGAGNDSISAGAGNDSITGGAGADTMVGGAGDDTFVFNAGDVPTTGARETISDASGSTTFKVLGDANFTHSEIQMDDTGQSHHLVLADDVTVTLGPSPARDSGHLFLSNSEVRLENLNNDGAAHVILQGNTPEGDTFSLSRFVLEEFSGTVSMVGVGTNDTLDMSSAGENLVINASASTSTLYGGLNSLTVTAIANSTKAYTNLNVSFSGMEAYVGGSGNDTILGGAAAEKIDMGYSTYSIENTYYSAGDESVAAGGGNDTIDAVNRYNDGTGVDGHGQLNSLDTVDGGAGYDTLKYAAATPLLNGEENHDWDNVSGVENILVEGSVSVRVDLASTSTLLNNLSTSTLSIDASSLSGTASFNFDASQSLNSTVNLQIVGSNHNNTIIGSAGNDTFTGGSGNDSIDSGLGVDSIIASLGNDTIHGGGGNSDTLSYAGFENDGGGKVTATFTGLNAANVSLYSVDQQSLVGSQNFDGVETLIGSTGNADSLTFAGLTTFQNTGVTVDLTQGTGNVQYGVGSGDMPALSQYTVTGFEKFTGSANNDTFTGSTGNDNFNGGQGADSLTGNAGNDTFVGGAGADIIHGGADSDTLDYYAEGGAGYIEFTGTTSDSATIRDTNGDVDTVNGIEKIVLNDANYTTDTSLGMSNLGLSKLLSAGQSTFTLDGSHLTSDNSLNFNASTVTSAYNLSVIGGAGDDNLTVGEGNDTLEGNAGNDGFNIGYSSSLVGGHYNAGQDSVLGGDGNDVIDAVNRYDAGSGEDGHGQLTSLDVVKGEGGYDTLTYAAADTSLDGVANHDWDNVSGVETITIVGTHNVNVVADSGLTSSLEDNQLNINASALDADFTFNGAAITDLNINLYIDGTTQFGGDDPHVNNIIGGAGADTIIGGAGADTFTGGAGADSLTGGTGVDVLDFSRECGTLAITITGNNTITDTFGAEDTISGIEKIVLNDATTSLTVNDELMDLSGNTFTIDGSKLTGQHTLTVHTPTLMDYALSLIGGTGADASGNGDTLVGGEKNDTIEGMGVVSAVAGNGDSLDGGDGTNTLSYAHLATNGTGVSISANGAQGTAEYTGANSVAHEDEFSSFSNFIGSAHDDTMTAIGSSYSLSGLAGADNITAGDGNDTLTGGAGADQLDGGKGDNIFVYNTGDVAAGETITSAQGTGTLIDATQTILVQSSTDFSAMADNAITFTNETTDIIEGDTIYGSLDQVLSLTGEGTEATFNLGTLISSGTWQVKGEADTAQTLTLNVSGEETISDGWLDFASLEAWVLGEDALHVKGSAAADVIAVRNMDGGLRTDLVLFGNAGNDQLNVEMGYEAGSATVIGGAGDDIIHGTSGMVTVDYSQETGGAATTLTYSGNGKVLITDAFGGTDTVDGVQKVVLHDASTSITLNTDIVVALLGGLTTGRVYVDGSHLTGTNALTLSATETHSTISLSILGGQGADDFTAGDGNATLDGGAGNDMLTGGSGNDSILGGTGADIITGGEGNDSIFGGAGNDTINASTGNDKLHGGADTDTLDFSTVLSGGEALTVSYTAADTATAAFTIDSTLSTQTLDGVENIIGGAGTNILTFAGLSADASVTIDLRTSNPNAYNVEYSIYNQETMQTTHNYLKVTDFGQFTGSQGNDTFYASSTTQAFIGSGGNDTADYSDAANVSGSIGLENYQIVSTLVETLIGSNYDDDIHANGNVRVEGRGGDDTIDGHLGIGNQTLYGGDGDDLLSGGAGSDSLHGNLGDDTIEASSSGTDVYHGDEGSNTLSFARYATVNVTLGADGSGTFGQFTYDGFQNIIGTSGNDTITGNSSDNVITGGAGNDSIHAGAGDDTVHMGTNLTGADTLYGQEDGNGSNDVLHYTDNAANQSQLTNVRYFDHIIFDNTDTNVNETLTSTNVSNDLCRDYETLDINASSLDSGHTLTFDATGVTEGYLYIQGGAGADIITGGNGSDHGDWYSNIIFGGGEADSLKGSTGNTDMFLYRTQAEIGTPHDTITIFETGVDKIAFYSTEAGGEFGYSSNSHAGYATATAAAQAHVYTDGAAHGAEACWYSNGTDLIYDTNGATAGGELIVATGVTSVQQTDIVIVDANHAIV